MSDKSAETEHKLIRQFIHSDPEKAALAFEGLSPSDSAGILSAMPPAESAACIAHMSPHNAARTVEALSPHCSAAILRGSDPHHVADIMMRLPTSTRQNVSALLDRGFLTTINEIISYPRDSAGRMMKKEFVAFRSEMKVSAVVSRLREMASRHDYNTYCYVVGQQNKLLGILNTRDLLIAMPDQRVSDIMRTRVETVSPFTDREDLTRLFRDKKYFAIPVVDERGALAGVISAESVIAEAEAEVSEDMQILFGAGAEERPHSPISFKIRKRLPWLCVNLATAFLAAMVVSMFENLIAQVAVLAVFLSVIAGQGGNAGIQTLSVALRGLIMREVTVSDARRLLTDEALVGLANGLVIGLITGVAAWIWKGNALLGFIVGAAMVANMLAAGISGAILPLLLKRLGQDPAHSSGIFVTTITDIVGFASLLGLAYLFRGYLI
ncbi:MAG: magnesium transporter [Elusimicrobia bacterium]|nr:magnesium transporter [Elusimicrobiota bacterium]